MTIQEEILLSYDEYVIYLIEKYGSVKGNYFTDKSCQIYTKEIKRTREGLYIHHIDEDKVSNLSSMGVASQVSFEYQLADRLVYCDVIEHLLLHIKIFKETSQTGLGIMGALTLISEINSYYEYGIPISWRSAIAEKIKSRFDDYLSILYDLVWVLYWRYGTVESISDRLFVTVKEEQSKRVM